MNGLHPPGVIENYHAMLVSWLISIILGEFLEVNFRDSTEFDGR